MVEVLGCLQRYQWQNAMWKLLVWRWLVMKNKRCSLYHIVRGNISDVDISCSWSWRSPESCKFERKRFALFPCHCTSPRKRRGCFTTLLSVAVEHSECKTPVKGLTATLLEEIIWNHYWGKCIRNDRINERKKDLVAAGCRVLGIWGARVWKSRFSKEKILDVIAP